MKMKMKVRVTLVEEWLDYWALRGLGQWRNSGKGRATWQKIEPERKGD